MSIAIKYDGGNCKANFTLSSCADNNIRFEEQLAFSNESDTTIEIDNAENFYGQDVMVQIDYSCDDSSKRLFIPNMNPTG